MTTKETVLDLIKRLPDDVTLVDILYELNFRSQVDDGLRQLDAGESLTHDNAQQKLGKWLT